MDIRPSLQRALEELIQTAKLEKGDLLVVGCSSSEVAGGRIGKQSSPEVGRQISEVCREVLQSRGIDLAAQCCEHLNRALVMEKRAAKERGYEQVNAIPQPHAGGSFAVAVYAAMEDPVLVEEVQADAGLDIGHTLIGMHLKRVAVPVRLSVSKIGEAALVAARVRPKYTGGPRAVYDENLM